MYRTIHEEHTEVTLGTPPMENEFPVRQAHCAYLTGNSFSVGGVLDMKSCRLAEGVRTLTARSQHSKRATKNPSSISITADFQLTNPSITKQRKSYSQNCYGNECFTCHIIHPLLNTRFNPRFMTRSDKPTTGQVWLETFT